MGRSAIRPPMELSSEDAVERFLDATCAYGTPDCAVAIEAMAHLYWVYRRWCSRKRIKPMGVSGLGRALSEHGFTATKIGEGNARRRAWKGLRLDAELREAAENSLAIKAERATKARKTGPSRHSMGAEKQVASVGIVWKFLNLCTKREAAAIELFSDLFAAFRQWCEVRDYVPIGRRQFGEILTRRFRIESDRVGRNRAKAKVGIRLLPAMKPPASAGSSWQ